MSNRDLTALEKNEALLARLKADDPTAVEEIYDTYYGVVYFFASNFLGDDEEVRDISVSAFAKAWKRRATFQTFDEIRYFLITATRNACIDHLRKKKTDKKKLKEYAYHLNIGFGNPEEADSDQELLVFLESFMGRFLEGKKKSTLLMTMQGKKDSEIAASLNITIQTVQNYRYLALKVLRKRLLQAR